MPWFSRLIGQRFSKALNKDFANERSFKAHHVKPCLTARLLTKGRRIELNISQQKQQLMTDNIMLDRFFRPTRVEIPHEIFLVFEPFHFFSSFDSRGLSFSKICAIKISNNPSPLEARNERIEYDPWTCCNCFPPLKAIQKPIRKHSFLIFKSICTIGLVYYPESSSLFSDSRVF